MEKVKSLSEQEIRNFRAVLPTLIQDVMDDPEVGDIPETNSWLVKVIQYNVNTGKQIRGLATALAYKHLESHLTDENVHLSYVLGWCVEILQAFFLVADDIMDGSTTRRGRPCWYLADGHGAIAFNDAILLENSVYPMLRKYFKGKDYYLAILEAFHDATFKTTCGQSLDTRTGVLKQFDTYTPEHYDMIVKYKTSYYSFYLPLCLPMIMVGIQDKKIFKDAEGIALAMGHLFQVQDDYLDCYGNVESTGKIGTDVVEGKCTWLIVHALAKATKEQRQVLSENYGKNDPGKVERVKKLFVEMKLREAYLVYEEEQHKLINEQIQKLSPGLPKDLFYSLLEGIYKRKT